jgi:beta-lactamase regulating signal transducer with metallopeptidase domain
LFLEAAVRTLVMGAIIFVALRLLRIEQVRARRTAWLLALAGALAMPLLVAAQVGPRLLPDIAFAKQSAVETTSPLRQTAGASSVAPPGGAENSFWVDHGSSSEDSSNSADRPAADSTPLIGTVLRFLIVGYCAVAAVLFLRLCIGLGFAWRLRNQAERVKFTFDPQLDARASERLASPATVGSSVLLPKNYKLWDGATLRIVLSHERAHVRQKDFYVHALAGLNCALFWFNPFSWWLRRQLSELGEALSDCAAVEEADSRASYAETLLAFATRTRWPETYVAMAGNSNLTPRIERLLNDQGFERSFAPKQRLHFVAAGVVLLALLASTSMVRVNAASADAVGPSDAAPVQGAAQTTTTDPTSATPTTPATSVTPTSKKKMVRVKRVVVDSDTHDSNADFDADEAARASEEADRAVEEADRAAEAAARGARGAADEEAMDIRSGDSHISFNMGRLFDSRMPASGDYIYFQHDSKMYVIQDPKILQKAQALLAPMKDLSEKQRALGHEQRELGAQQRDLAKQQRSIRLAESPQFKHEMDELQKRLKEIDLPRLTAQIDQQTLAEVQAHLGEIQSQVGHLQAEFGMHGHEFGEQMSKLGQEQGKLGREQGKLGEEQRRIVEEAKRQLKPIIEQAIRDGAATPLVK